MLKHNCEHYVGTACPMCAKEDSELIAKLQSQLRVAVETIKFYADRNSWKLPSFTSDVKEVIEMSDLGCKSFSGENNFADYAIPSGGRRARETLAALEGKE